VISVFCALQDYHSFRCYCANLRHLTQGAGEVLRGTLNSAVERSLNQPPEVVQHYRDIAYDGKREIKDGHRPGHHMGPTGGSARPMPAVDERTTNL